MSPIGLLLAALLYPASEHAAKNFQTVKVAEGIYAFVAQESRSGLVSGNSIAILGDDGVLVVDSGHFPTLTRRMIEEIRHLSDKPVRYVVNTHWHPDHHSGNFVYREAFPQVVVVSTAYTREQMERQAKKYDQPESLAGYVPILRARLASGKNKDGSPLSDDDRRYFEYGLADIEDVVPELKKITLVRPDVGFEHRLAVFLGKRRVDVMFLGRGNTGGDAVVYVPDAKVLATGDLVVAPTPYGYGSFIGEWIETLKKLEAIDAVAIVPGHGPVQHDKEYVRLVRNTLESVFDQTKAAVKAGFDLGKTRAKVDLETFRKRFAADDGLRSRAFRDFFAVPVVERAFREARQGPLNDED